MKSKLNIQISISQQPYSDVIVRFFILFIMMAILTPIVCSQNKKDELEFFKDEPFLLDTNTNDSIELNRDSINYENINNVEAILIEYFIYNELLNGNFLIQKKYYIKNKWLTCESFNYYFVYTFLSNKT